MATAVCGPADCRTIGIGGEVYEAIPMDLVVKAGLIAASQIFGTETNKPCCESKAPKALTTICCSK